MCYFFSFFLSLCLYHSSFVHPPSLPLCVKQSISQSNRSSSNLKSPSTECEEPPSSPFPYETALLHLFMNCGFTCATLKAQVTCPWIWSLIHFHRLISDDLLVNLLLKWEVELTSITGEPKQALDSIDFITETVALVIN